MSLTAADVNKIAYLARLGIDTQDTESYAKDLSGMLELVAQMSTVNTDNVAPMAHPLDQSQRLRPDQVSESNQREDFQRIAPQVEDNLYLVPKVIE
ncbi:MAG: Asp-tRNA(Asn)/Glu-tRNA(Gln) amidotransferase subunit GatC [Gammaproteobacteria bacterium]|uniref:Asp-tRNA(Asn)/Glu-tRNA(Gln) amidotransferase subunit GatC n=1 Tax=Methyloprofundus sp. TaxID=2020875 RepID=UPI001A13449D|nr:Asp-tRNA(Asn)/Glu-tRNA(Gln) amidotransferase subunit GatC [Methyloprofundus sp.]MBT3811719.1 Asp-tRNA(Asn)/Glu-tRNA(Gln) amidotransferase subunit GatC [Gammaproteobacteria bacterium]HIL77720.1 Asp-tRNA(Asn)/Glu-tRNA(Gln) amidotransferase subunit GatC [Methylococcales bacterium]MBT6420784.1 Asp-tRNA(Asn)/Glu-tRNA(Gln) amidotransferase subunit GatC [Gammaproteobacteria bacterium]MBT6576406.1 Asp-tRNA(Asn)/Glu-tRNA(Gln) amidotransferase subunit GatC [Gammaproteobacteria bacterium]MBT7436126.1 